MVWQQPKTDWVTNPKNPKSEDFNRIEGNIDFLKQDIETKKGLIVDALLAGGIDANIMETYPELAQKIEDIAISGASKKRWATGQFSTTLSGGKSETVNNLAFKPSMVIIYSEKILTSLSTFGRGGFSLLLDSNLIELYWRVAPEPEAIIRKVYGIESTISSSFTTGYYRTVHHDVSRLTSNGFSYHNYYEKTRWIAFE